MNLNWQDRSCIYSVDVDLLNVGKVRGGENESGSMICHFITDIFNIISHPVREYAYNYSLVYYNDTLATPFCPTTLTPHVVYVALIATNQDRYFYESRAVHWNL